MELLTVTTAGGGRLLRLTGELDLSSAHVLTAALDPATERSGDLTMDLAGLTFMDSYGLHVVLRAAQALHGNLVLKSPNPFLARVLEIAGVRRLSNVRIVQEATQRSAASFG